MFLSPSRRNGPDLARLQRIATNAVFALQLWCRNKFFNTIGTHHIAEVRVAEFSRADAFLLLLDATPCFHGNANGPLEVCVGHLPSTWVEQFEQPAHGLVDRIGITPG